MFNRVWNHYFHHPFWGVFPPLFLVQHPYLNEFHAVCGTFKNPGKNICDYQLGTSPNQRTNSTIETGLGCFYSYYNHYHLYNGKRQTVPKFRQNWSPTFNDKGHAPTLKAFAFHFCFVFFVGQLRSATSGIQQRISWDHFPATWRAMNIVMSSASAVYFVLEGNFHSTKTPENFHQKNTKWLFWNKKAFF